MICCPVCLGLPEPRADHFRCRCGRLSCTHKASGDPVWRFRYAFRGEGYFHMDGLGLWLNNGDWGWTRVDERERSSMVEGAVSDLLARLVLEV